MDSLNIERGISEEIKIKQFKQIEKKRDSYYKQSEKVIIKQFNAERKQLIKELKKVDKDMFLATVDTVLKEQSDNWIDVFTAIYKTTILKFGKETFGNAINLKAYTQFNERIKNFIINTVAQNVSYVSRTTKNQIRKIIDDTLAEGLDITQTKNKILNEIDTYYLDAIYPYKDRESRATTIARTEVVRASNFGSLEGATQASEQTGLELMKYWIPTYDDRVRDTHLQAGSQKPIKLNETFNIGGFSAKYPADESLPAKESVNCRCSIGYIKVKKETPIVEPAIVPVGKINPIIKGSILAFEDVKTLNKELKEITAPRVFYGGGEQDLDFKEIAKMQNFTALGDVLPEKEFEEYVKENNLVVGYRGVKQKENEYIEQLKRGEDIFAGTGISGSGTYTAFYKEKKYLNAAYNTALDFAGDNEKNVVKLAYKKDAKIIERTKLVKLVSEESEKIKKEISNLLEENPVVKQMFYDFDLINQNLDISDVLYEQIIDQKIFAGKVQIYYELLKDNLSEINNIKIVNKLDELSVKLRIINDFGRYAALLGYDIINIESSGYRVVLNRSALIFREEQGYKSLKKLTQNSYVDYSRRVGYLLSLNAFILSSDELSKLRNELEKYKDFNSLPIDLKNVIIKAESNLEKIDSLYNLQLLGLFAEIRSILKG